MNAGWLCASQEGFSWLAAKVAQPIWTAVMANAAMVDPSVSTWRVASKRLMSRPAANVGPFFPERPWPPMAPLIDF